MDVREAVAVAKGYLTNLYTDEAIEHLGLEEVEFDECADTWRVTLGFSRPWDRAPLPERHPLAPALAHSMAPSPLRRAYKEIRISDEDGRVESEGGRAGQSGPARYPSRPRHDRAHARPGWGVGAQPPQETRAHPRGLVAPRKSGVTLTPTFSPMDRGPHGSRRADRTDRGRVFWWR